MKPNACEIPVVNQSKRMQSDVSHRPTDDLCQEKSPPVSVSYRHQGG